MTKQLDGTIAVTKIFSTNHGALATLRTDGGAKNINDAIKLGHGSFMAEYRCLLTYIPAYSPNLNLIERLWIDEIGYLSYSNRHADLLFEIVNCRYRGNIMALILHNPEIARMTRCISPRLSKCVPFSTFSIARGVMFVGDSKMSALETRQTIDTGEDYYLTQLTGKGNHVRGSGRIFRHFIR